MTGVGWYSQQILLNFLNLVKFYICKPKSTGRGSLIKKQTIFVRIYAFFIVVVGKYIFQRTTVKYGTFHTVFP
jgi:hypothetical protein